MSQQQQRTSSPSVHRSHANNDCPIIAAINSASSDSSLHSLCSQHLSSENAALPSNLLASSVSSVVSDSDCSFLLSLRHRLFPSVSSFSPSYDDCYRLFVCWYLDQIRLFSCDLLLSSGSSISSPFDILSRFICIRDDYQTRFSESCLYLQPTLVARSILDLCISTAKTFHWNSLFAEHPSNIFTSPDHASGLTSNSSDSQPSQPSLNPPCTQYDADCDEDSDFHSKLW